MANQPGRYFKGTVKGYRNPVERTGTKESGLIVTASGQDFELEIISEVKKDSKYTEHESHVVYVTRLKDGKRVKALQIKS